MSINFYTIHCPKCDVLEKKLNNKNIKYTLITDVGVMQQKDLPSLVVKQMKIFNLKEVA
jgi:glutaredoxin-related protein